MIWRNFLTAVLVLSAMGIAFCLFNLWIGFFKSVSTSDLAIGAFQIIACSMGFAGSDELTRRGHDKIRRSLFKYSIVSLAISMIALAVAFLSKIKWSFLITYSFMPFWVLLIASFPLALYLNRSQKDSNSRPTVDDAS
jgi:hypothetical protein